MSPSVSRRGSVLEIVTRVAETPMASTRHANARRVNIKEREGKRPAPRR